MAKKEQNTKFKKAPQAPRRFKSAYMFFSTEKHKSIRLEKDQGKKLQTTDVAKMVSQAWKDLPPQEREEWEEMARRDKARYEVEKSMYTGPWKVPATKARSQKDPNAPKRPMSAFLSYSNSKRAAVKAKNQDLGNAEVSRILAKMWKEAPEEERRAHIEKEFELRQKYKCAIAIWRQNVDDELKAVRKKREDIALQRLDSPESPLQTGAPLNAEGNHSTQPQYATSSNKEHQEQDVLDSSSEEKKPARSSRAAPAAPYHSGAPHYNTSMGYSSAHVDENGAMIPPYASYPPTGGGGSSMDHAARAAATYNNMTMPMHAYPDAYSSEYGAHPNGYEHQHPHHHQGYPPNMEYYGSYYPPPTDHNGGWPGNPYYGAARHNGPPHNPYSGAPPPHGYPHNGGGY